MLIFVKHSNNIVVVGRLEGEVIFTVDLFTSGARAYTVACADKMERSNLDKKPEVAAESVKFRDEVAPQSDNATDHIAEHPLHVPFHDVLFAGAETSNYEVNPRNRGSRCRANGDTLPDTCVWLGQLAQYFIPVQSQRKLLHELWRRSPKEKMCQLRIFQPEHILRSVQRSQELRSYSSQRN